MIAPLEVMEGEGLEAWPLAGKWWRKSDSITSSHGYEGRLLKATELWGEGKTLPGGLGAILARMKSWGGLR